MTEPALYAIVLVPWGFLIATVLTGGEPWLLLDWIRKRMRADAEGGRV